MKITIITINLNNVIGLEDTIKSVLSQTYKNFEYIIIDGDSRDGSKEIIAKYNNDFSYWISEPDKGVYNAMNKGVEKAKGEYLLFLNSGDSLNNESVLNDFISSNPIEDIVYGDAWITGREEKPIYKKMPNVLDAKKCLQFTITHQAIFHKKILFKNMKFDESYSIISDWVFYNKAILIDKASYRHLNFPIVLYDGTGISSDNKFIKKRENERSQFYMKIAPFVIKELLIEKEIHIDFRQSKRLIIRLANKIDNILIKLGI